MSAKVSQYVTTDAAPVSRSPGTAALVAAVLTSAQLTTSRTSNRWSRGFDEEDQTAVTPDNDQDDAPAIRLCPSRRRHRRPSSMATLARSAADRKSLDTLSGRMVLVEAGFRRTRLAGTERANLV